MGLQEELWEEYKGELRRIDRDLDTFHAKLLENKTFHTAEYPKIIDPIIRRKEYILALMSATVTGKDMPSTFWDRLRKPEKPAV